MVYTHIYGNMHHVEFSSLLMMFYKVFGVHLSFNTCDTFVAGEACVYMRYCTSSRTYTVSYSLIHMTILTWFSSGLTRIYCSLAKVTWDS